MSLVIVGIFLFATFGTISAEKQKIYAENPSIQNSKYYMLEFSIESNAEKAFLVLDGEKHEMIKENGKWTIVHNLPEDTLVFSGFYDKLVKSIYRERYEDPDTGVMEAFRNSYNEGKYGVLIAGNGREGTDNAIKQRILYSLSCSYHIGDKEKVYEQGFYRD